MQESDFYSIDDNAAMKSYFSTISYLGGPCFETDTSASRREAKILRQLVFRVEVITVTRSRWGGVRLPQPFPFMMWTMTCFLILKSTMQIRIQDVIPTSHLIATFKSLLNGNSKIIPG